MPRVSLDGLLEPIAQRRANRRTALAAGLAGTLSLSGLHQSLAQDATAEAGDAAGDPMFLFVQLAEGGTWIPSPDDPEIYHLTLSGVGSLVAFFSDRPERIVGTVDTTRFLDALGFTPINPPNAAAVVRTPEGERDVLVIELFDPVYTQAFGSESGATVQYSARVLDAYHGDNLESWYAEQDDPELPSQFDQVSLFIDDCPDATSCSISPNSSPPNPNVRSYQGPIPDGPYGTCWDKDYWVCNPCVGNWNYLNELCNRTYPDCQGYCHAS